jgi:hypothetical protein
MDDMYQQFKEQTNFQHPQWVTDLSSKESHTADESDRLADYFSDLAELNGSCKMLN